MMKSRRELRNKQEKLAFSDTLASSKAKYAGHITKEEE